MEQREVDIRTLLGEVSSNMYKAGKTYEKYEKAENQSDKDRYASIYTAFLSLANDAKRELLQRVTN